MHEWSSQIFCIGFHLRCVCEETSTVEYIDNTKRETPFTAADVDAKTIESSHKLEWSTVDVCW